MPSMADVSADVAEVMAELAARGKRITPERAERMVAAHLAAADRRHDRDADPDRNTDILGMIPDPTPADAFLPPGLRRSA